MRRLGGGADRVRRDTASLLAPRFQHVESVDTARVRVDTSQQHPGLVGAALDVVEASEQLKALNHGAPHWRRKAIFGWRRRRVV
jgi:hypothetical protein